MSLTSAKKKVKEFDLNDVLASATVAKEAKSKSKVPLLTVSEEIKSNASKLREIKEELDSLESMYETLSAQMIEKISPMRESVCKQGYQSSIRIPDSKGLSITISWSDKYCKIPPENEETFRSITGKKFDEYFTKDMTITVKDMSENTLKEIVKAIGPERFSQFFSVEKIIKPTSRFTQEQFTAFTHEQRQQLQQAGVRQHKPSIKVK